MECAGFEIGPGFEDSKKLARRDLRPLGGKFASSLFWVCFRHVCEGVHFHNPLLILY